MRRTDKRPKGERLGVLYDCDPQWRRFASVNRYRYEWRECAVCGVEFKLFWRNSAPMDCDACCTRCQDAEKCLKCGPDVCNEDGAE